MRFKTVLWKYAPRKDGTCAVKIRVFVKGETKYFQVEGVFVAPSDFLDSQGLVKQSHPLSMVYNGKIRALRNKLEEHFLTGGAFAAFAASEEEQAEKQSIIAFARNFVAEAEKGIHGLAEGTIKNYRSTLKRLEQYRAFKGLKDIFFEELDLQFEHDFRSYLMDRHGCKLIGAGKHFKIIKRLMNVAGKRGLHKSQDFRDFKVHKKSAGDKIYLTTQEIAQLESLDLSRQPVLERERDRFLLAYYFVQRFSDVSAIRRENVFQKNGKYYLRYRSVKTNIEATVPVKPAALQILEKYKYNLDFTTNQQANRELKTICAMAGINQLATEDGRTLPKGQLVTTHTARRSAATNMRLEGASLKTIADLGGWSGLNNLQLYLRASGFESSELAEGMAFFK